MKSRLSTWLLVLTVMVGCRAAASAQTNFATLVTDGAWTWYNDSRALFHNDRLYVGYVRASNGKSALDVFDLSTGVSENLWVSGFTQTDDHNNPALCAMDDGRLLAIYSRHISDQYFSYRTSITPDPVTSVEWNAEQSIPNSGAGMTYANPFQLSAEGGKIYNFCRNQNFNPTVYTSANGGSTWSSPRRFIATGSGGTRPYVKYRSDGAARIDFLYTDGHPRDVNNSLYHLYYQGGSYYQTDGSWVKDDAGLPILHDSGERGSVIYAYSAAPQTDPNQWIPAGRAWCWETTTDGNGAPVCVFTVQRDRVTGPNWSDDRIYYYYARWTGTAWQKRFIAQAGRPLYAAEDDYAGGICVDPQDPNVIYISSNASDPFDLTDTTHVPLTPTQRYELWRGVTSDGGLTFSWTPVTEHSDVDNLRPYVPRSNGGEPCVLWFRGAYSSYTSYACSIVGLFTTPVPIPPPPPKITYVDASSGPGGNTQSWSAGLQQWVPWDPPVNGVFGADNQWEMEFFANSGTWFESNREGTENAPQLRTEVSGLDYQIYDVYAYFWRAGGQGMTIGAGLIPNPTVGVPLYRFDSARVDAANRSAFSTNTVLVTEADRTMYQVHLGSITGTSVVVYIDDQANGGYGSTVWYDGIGYQLHLATVPPDIAMERDGAEATVSWPDTHLGWILQSTYPRADRWNDIDGSFTNVAFRLDPLAAAEPTGYFRLRHPAESLDLP